MDCIRESPYLYVLPDGRDAHDVFKNYSLSHLATALESLTGLKAIPRRWKHVLPLICSLTPLEVDKLQVLVDNMQSTKKRKHSLNLQSSNKRVCGLEAQIDSAESVPKLSGSSSDNTTPQDPSTSSRMIVFNESMSNLPKKHPLLSGNAQEPGVWDNNMSSGNVQAGRSPSAFSDGIHTSTHNIIPLPVQSNAIQITGQMSGSHSTGGSGAFSYQSCTQYPYNGNTWGPLPISTETSRQHFRADVHRASRGTHGEPSDVPPCCQDGYLQGLQKRWDWERSEFLKPPSSDVVEKCVGRFLTLTSNDALRREVCVVCSRLLFERNLVPIDINEIPNRHLLSPTVHHPAQVLTSGMLLCQEALERSDTTYICRECLTSLRGERVPRFSLANNLWMGPVPFELRTLTLPERLLISIYIPMSFIIKMYPKKIGGRHYSPSTLYDGLRGNVSSHPLNQNQIAAMLTKVKPAPLALLSETIGITFITPFHHKEKLIHGTLPGNFIVRRRKVYEALLWLKENNPLWAEIEISQERLASLPENGFPDELEIVTHHSGDIDKVAEEHASYDPTHESLEVPNDWSDTWNEDESNTVSSDIESDEPDIPEHDEGQGSPTVITPAVIPLENLGTFDINGNHITNQDMLSHAFANVTQSGSSCNEFGIRRGSAFVNEYPRQDPTTGERVDGGPSNPAHLLGCFPHLFPYAKGGFELARPTPLSYEAQAQFCLETVDPRFRNEPQSFFQMFGVLQKRKICQAASFQIEKPTFDACQEQMERVTMEQLRQASVEEMAHRPFSNPAIQMLRNHVTVVRRQVPGTDENRTLLRTSIWGASMMSSLPVLWVTLNPSDTHNPIAQVLVGEDIDLDLFSNLVGPDSQRRAQNITQDPYASALFFQVIIKAILEGLFGIKVHPSGKVERSPGVFGTIKHYVGAIEAQGRGSLHAHFLFWLDDSPTSNEVKEALKNPQFRQRVKEYIDQCFHADIEEKNNEDVRRISTSKDIGYSRPPNPRDDNFPQKVKQDKLRLARAVQYHECSRNRCLKEIHGQWVCKRRAPWQRSCVSWVSHTGEWGPKRLCGYLTTWNPTLLLCLRGNHDVELVLSGSVTQKIVWYITNYATKKQHKSSNSSAVFAKRLLWNRSRYDPATREDALRRNQHLLASASNSLSQNRELAAPEVINYLMGWNDSFLSNHYVGLQWGSAEAQLKKRFPHLMRGQRSTAESETQTVTIVDGHLMVSDQIRDYMNRPSKWVNMKYLDFVLETYERIGTPKDEKWHQRYQDGYKSDRFRVYRTQHHDVLPRVIGHWFPPNDEPDKYELYCASMLLLFKPWIIWEDLVVGYRSFADAFQSFKMQAPVRDLRIIENIQAYHDCARDAKEVDPYASTRIEPLDTSVSDFNFEGTCIDADERNSNAMAEEIPLLMPHDEVVVTQEMIDEAKAGMMSRKERQCIDQFMQVGYEAGLFVRNMEGIIRNTSQPIARNATRKDEAKISQWARQLKEAIRPSNMTPSRHMISTIYRPDPHIPPAVISTDSVNNLFTSDGWNKYVERLGEHLGRPNQPLCTRLNELQRKAHNVIMNHVLQTQAGQQPSQLLFMVLGEGGTGKSHVIHAVTEGISSLNLSVWLSKVAPTGIAASNIGGATIHSWGGISVATQNDDSWAVKSAQATTNEQRRRNHILSNTQYLIIDEISMVNQKLFHELDVITREVRKNEGCTNYDHPFGGINVIIMGDFYQFPPVKVPHAALYCEPDPKSPLPYVLGRQLFLQFDKVVVLDEQMRSWDPTWNGLLHRQREGLCTEEDIEIIRQLVLTNPACDVPDFTQSPWKDAVLITSRHVIRRMWNEEALKKLSADTGALRYQFPADDIDVQTGVRPTRQIQYVLAKRKHEESCVKLDSDLEVVIGMRAMVLFNISTDADIANGTRGVVKDLLLDPREGEIHVQEDNVVKLKYPPVVILFEPDVRSDIHFEGVPEGLVPLTPIEWTTTGRDLEGRYFKVKRRQYAITPAYALTDYKSQGQTINSVLIDLGQPPTGKPLSPFNAYVALSRGRGRQWVRLIRPFDEALFTRHPSEALRKDMQRIMGLASKTSF